MSTPPPPPYKSLIYNELQRLLNTIYQCRITHRVKLVYFAARQTLRYNCSTPDGVRAKSRDYHSGFFLMFPRAVGTQDGCPMLQLGDFNVQKAGIIIIFLLIFLSSPINISYLITQKRRPFVAELHTIKAHLYDNALTENPNDFIARAASEKSLTVADICQTAVKRGGADISASAMEHGVNLWLKEMAYRLCDGFSVHTGWFNVSAHIKGVFDSPNEKYNPEKHTVLFEFHQGALLRKELSNVSVEIIGVADTSLTVDHVVDIKTGSVNDVLTRNRNLRITGHKLKIAGDDADNGVYFVNQSTQERIKVDATDIVNNNPSELIIIIPEELTAGTYKVEVKTQFASHSKQVLKESRSCVFDKVLTVS
jgi:hypothetical protein